MANVIVVGSLNMDLVTTANKIPAPGETVIGGDLRTIPGGKGANQAVAATRLGSTTTMVGHVGNDGFADELRESLSADGIDLRHVTTVDGATGVALIVVDAAGQNSIVVASGANAKMTPGDVEAAEEAIAQADVLLLQLEIPLDSIVRAAELGRRHGVPVILNPAPARPLPAALLAKVDLLIPNESETATLTGLPTTDIGQLQHAAAHLRRLGVGAVILTLGEQGALLATDKETRHFAAFPMKTVVDTTAAGDAFVGGLATALAEKRALADAICWGSATGALAVTKAGAQPSLPTRADVQSLIDVAQPTQSQGILL